MSTEQDTCDLRHSLVPIFRQMEITMMSEKKNKPRQFKVVHRKWGGRKVKSIEPLLRCRVLARLLMLTYSNRGDGVCAHWLSAPCMLQAGEMRLVSWSTPLQSLPLLCLGRHREEFSTSCPERIFSASDCLAVHSCKW